MSTKRYLKHIGALGVAWAIMVPGSQALAQAEQKPVECEATPSVADLATFSATKANKRYRILVSVPSLANPYVVALTYGAFLAGEEAGVDVSVSSGTGFTDSPGQIRALENALSRGADAVVIAPADPAALAPTIDELVDKGIPVFEFGSASNSTKSRKVVQDDFAVGQGAVRALARHLPEGGEGILMGGPQVAGWAQRRVAGFQEELKKHPNIKLNAIAYSDISPAEGLAKFQNAAQAHPKVDWIYSTYSLLLPPTAIPPEYQSSVFIGSGSDAIMIEAVKNDTAAAALAEFPIASAYLAVSDAVKVLNGDTSVGTWTCLPSGAEITKENVSDPVWARYNEVPEGWTVPLNK